MSMKSGWLCALGAVALASNIVMARQSPRTVPTYLVSTVDRPLAEFCRLVARVMPAGFETREADDVAPLRSTTIPDGQATATLTELIAAFNRANGIYRAESIDGVLVVRPIDARSRLLDSPSPIRTPTTQLGVMQSIRSALSVETQGVRAGSASGLLSLEGLSKSITLDGSGSRRVLDTLNQVAVQTPGAWQVITRRIADEITIVRYAFIYSDGVRTRGQMPTNRP